MNTILERIKKVYRLETDADLADFLGMNPSTLSMQKNRGRVNLRLIIDKCRDINLNWLLHGEGPMRLSENGKGSIQIPVFSEAMLPLDGNGSLKNEYKIGWLSAGGELLEKLNIDNSTESLLGYVISDYPIPPILTKNDIAIFNKTDRRIEEGIYLVSISNKLVCGRVQKSSSNNYIIQNPRLEADPVILEAGENKSNILGKMVWAMQKKT
ncbi:helix-turn-helix domain-containing protein [Fodinibius saliphilus]|uniref:helix-turn-helix domain-containing protein n=1 Tax=Fodinibius saliphilus TaxID=1920650 RepID=UPI001109CE64|nr:helix-turn-helix domain-containing protein [Fodinibius saliphilus]